MKIKREYARAAAAAEQLMSEIEPYCERIEVAGSLRRHKPEIGDIEIVAIAKPLLNLFGEPTEGNEIDSWLYQRSIATTKNGSKYKQFEYEHEGERYQVDLFLAQPDNFGLIHMIRTGSAEFSKRMMTAQSYAGYLPAGLRVAEGHCWRNGAMVAVESEADLFALWNMATVAPEDR